MKKIVDYKDKKYKVQLLEFQDNIFTEFDKLLKDLSISNYKKSALITYWLNEYKNYLFCEGSFSPQKLVKYKRGTIVKANLGFNIGNEQGGLHYCVVLNKNDSINIPLLNVIPLTSKKNEYKKIHYTSVDLGNEIYAILNSKLEEKLWKTEEDLSNLELMQPVIDNLLDILENIKLRSKNDENIDFIQLNLKVDELLSLFNGILSNKYPDGKGIYPINESIKKIKIESVRDFDNLLELTKNYQNAIINILTTIKVQIDVNKKIMREISNMKKGSIAHVDQITTISKMRIYNPKSTGDALYNIKLSNESLTLIDNKIKELFTY